MAMLCRRLSSIISSRRTPIPIPTTQKSLSSTLSHMGFLAEMPVKRFEDPDVKSYAYLAIEHYNRKNCDHKLQLVEIVRGYAQRVQGKNYFLTLKAKVQDGAPKLFRTWVWLNPYHKEGTEILITEFVPISDNIKESLPHHVRTNVKHRCSDPVYRPRPTPGKTRRPRLNNRAVALTPHCLGTSPR